MREAGFYLLLGEGFTCSGGTWEGTDAVHSNNGEGECWILGFEGFEGARVPDLTDPMSLCVSVVTMHEQNMYGTRGTVRGSNGYSQVPVGWQCCVLSTLPIRVIATDLTK